MRIQTHRLSMFIALILTPAFLIGCNTTAGQFSNQVGSSQYKKGNYTAAKNSFARAVADRPDNPDYVYNLASALQKQGDTIGAEQTYRRALQIDPGHQPTYHGLATLMNEQGRQAESMQLVRSWVETQPYKPASHIEMAWLQRENGQVAEAQQSLQTALRIQPNHPIALAQLGQVYQDQGQTQQASALYKRSLANKWSQPHVQSRLAMLEDQHRIQSYRPGGTMTASGWGVPQSTTAWHTTQPGMTASTFLPPTYVSGPPATFAAQPTSTYSATTPVVTTPVTTALPAENQFNADPAHVDPAQLSTNPDDAAAETN